MKRIFTFFLCITILVSFGIPAFADASGLGEMIPGETIIGEKYVAPGRIGLPYPNAAVPLDDYNEIPVVRDTIETKKTVYVTPAGQPSLGFEGGNGGFVFFYHTGGNSVKFSVTINAKLVTFYAETGKQTSDGAGYCAQIPMTSGRYQFQFQKNYVITTKIIDVYQYGQYKYSYETHSAPYSVGYRWVKL